MGDWDAVKETISYGVSALVSVVLIAFLFAMLFTDSQQEAGELFNRTTDALLLVILPSTEFGVLVSFFSSAFGSIVLFDDFNDSVSGFLAGFGFLWALVTFLSNLLTISVL